MDKKNNLPVYELKIDPTKGFEVDRISIVDSPAVESNFLVFNQVKEEEIKQLFTTQKDNMELLGVAMTPDKLILRQHPITKEFYNVFFSKETIRSIAQDFFYKGYQHSINLQHTNTMVDAHVFQSFIVDFEKGINPPKGLENVNNGSWVVGMKINASANGNKVWEKIKDDNLFKGFSIEGYFLDQLAKDFSIEKFQNADSYYQSLLELEAVLDEFIKAKNL